MWGYFGRDRAASGILDPLYARVLVLRGVTGSVALVSLDLGTTPDASLLEPLRSRLQSSERLDAVIFSATHTHAAPGVQRAALKPGAATAWMHSLLERIADAVKEACSLVQPVRLGFGTGSSWIANNRRFIRPDGAVQMISRDSPKVRNFPIDPTVRVARLDRLDGSALGVVVHYACHPVALGGDNLRYSADWPGAMVDAIEAQVPGKPLAMFLQGALGDINLIESLAGKTGEAERLEIGRSIGEEAARVACSIETLDHGPVHIRTAVSDFSFANRWDCEQLMRLTDNDPKRPVAIFRNYYARELSAKLSTVAVGDSWLWVTMPGEPFIDFQLRLSHESTIPHSWLLGCADGYLGYFPTTRAAMEGGYGAQGCEAWVEVGAGERILNHALLTLYGMNRETAAIPPESS